MMIKINPTVHRRCTTAERSSCINLTSTIFHVPAVCFLPPSVPCTSLPTQKISPLHADVYWNTQEVLCTADGDVNRKRDFYCLHCADFAESDALICRLIINMSMICGLCVRERDKGREGWCIPPLTIITANQSEFNSCEGCPLSHLDDTYKGFDCGVRAACMCALGRVMKTDAPLSFPLGQVTARCCTADASQLRLPSDCDVTGTVWTRTRRRRRAGEICLSFCLRSNSSMHHPPSTLLSYPYLHHFARLRPPC